MKYYLLMNGETKGPFALTTVREMLAVGAIQEMTLIAPEGGSGWSPVGIFLAEFSTIANATSETLAGSGSVHATTSQKWYGNRKVQVAAALLFGIGFLAYLENERSAPRNTASYDEGSTDAEPPKKKANSGAYNLYMQGYNDPKQGDVAEMMLRRSSGDEAQGYSIIALGAEDRRAGRPPRFELDRSLD